MRKFLKKELYGLLDRVFAREDSKEVATDRLRFILVHDRNQMEPEKMEAMRNELVDVLAKYIEFDQSELAIQFEKEKDSIALVANIPIRQLKRN